MGYVHYTKTYRTRTVNAFFKSGLGLYKYCKQKGIQPRTFYRWIEGDSRYDKRKILRIEVKNTHFSFETKLDAVKLKLSGVDPHTVADKFSTTVKTIYSWLHAYQEKGEYALMAAKDIKNSSGNTEASLKKQIEELKKENFKKQLKIDAYEATLSVLKNYPGLSLEQNLSDLTNSIKVEVISKLRPKYELKVLLQLFKLRRQTYYDGVVRVKATPKWGDYDAKVLEFIKDDPKICGKKGYREVMKSMSDADNWDNPIIERRIRKVMQDNNLLAFQTKTMKRFNSYKNDGNPPVKNWLYDKSSKEHFFKPKNIWEILGTDVTEFHVNGFKVFLSPIIDFKDSMPVVWRISKHPDTDLIVGTVDDLHKVAPDDARFILHMDQGSVNRSAAMISACDKYHILQSMSRKGKSGDNAPTEGFFGTLKQEWFNKTEFIGYTYEQFASELNDWLIWYREKRHNFKIGGLTPMQYRKMIELQKVA